MKVTKVFWAVLAYVSISVAGASSAALAADTIKIGEIQTYSKLTNFTFPYRNGWQLALEEINNSGGVLGKQLEVISRDDDGKPGTAVTVAEELVRKDKVALLMGTFFSNVGLAVTDFAKRNKVLFVAAEPRSNAHGPNEFLDIRTGMRLTCCVARVLEDHLKAKAA